ncbi:hypothetical protein FOXB_09471 [Fusarium oxysporum f. sp. conglutinans Fo5176]|uniref:Uncharacterized protein n=1 Tax=Fusarium oxysporum (strain Fo5176) TaxID=660025 RepID=F9FSU0_FUSOF|nr:hypothetical protein FOXB_09471 [Fusarium oxysporum f. sp. conglutinans Fo5176]
MQDYTTQETVERVVSDMGRPALY